MKLAQDLLDRFFRDAEGRTNRQLDVYFTLEDMGLSRDKAEPAMEYLVSRGLVNAFGPDIAFLTDLGIEAISSERELGDMPKVLRDFEQVARSEPEPAQEDLPAQELAGRPAVEVPQVIHIGLDGNEFVQPLQWICTVGRAEGNDIQVDDQRASKNHAEIRYEDGGYVLHDLESANGTLLNGEYVVEPTPLKNDDEVVIGRTMLLFQTPLPVPPPNAPKPADMGAGLGAEAASALPPTERPGPAEMSLPMPVIMGTPDLPTPMSADEMSIPEAIIESPAVAEAPPPFPAPEGLDAPQPLMSPPAPGSEPVEPAATGFDPTSEPFAVAEPPAFDADLIEPELQPIEPDDGPSALQMREPLSVVTGDVASPAEEEAHPEPEYLEPSDVQPALHEPLLPEAPPDPQMPQTIEGDDGATVMMSREAMFGTADPVVASAVEPASSDAAEDLFGGSEDLEGEPETLPPGMMAPLSDEDAAEAATPAPEVEAQVPAIIEPLEAEPTPAGPAPAAMPPRFPPSARGRPKPAPISAPVPTEAEPALLTLLEAIRERLLNASSVPDRMELLKAVELLQEHPSIQALARAVEREFTSKDPG